MLLVGLNPKPASLMLALLFAFSMAFVCTLACMPKSGMTNGELSKTGSNGWLKFVAVVNCLSVMSSGRRRAGEESVVARGKKNGRGGIEG